MAQRICCLCSWKIARALVKEWSCYTNYVSVCHMHLIFKFYMKALKVYPLVDNSIKEKIWPNPPKIKNAKKRERERERLSLEDINVNSLLHHRKISSCVYFKSVPQPRIYRMNFYWPKAEGPCKYSCILAVRWDSLLEKPFFFKPEWLEITLK